MRIWLLALFSLLGALPSLAQVSQAAIKESADCNCIAVEFETRRQQNHCNSYSLWRYDSAKNEKTLVVDKSATGISQVPQRYSLSDCTPKQDYKLKYILYFLSRDVTDCVAIADTLSIDTLELTCQCYVRRCTLLKYIITPEHNSFHPLVPEQHTLEIYNRWGEKVFETSNKDKGWDGGASPAGVYFWVISFPDKSKKMLSGSVTLLKP